MDWSRSMGEVTWGTFRSSDTLIIPLWPLLSALVGIAVATTAVRREGPPIRWWALLALAPIVGWGVAITLLADRWARLEALWLEVTVGLLGGLAPLVVLARGAGRARVERLAPAALLALPLALQLIWMGATHLPFLEVDYAPHQHLGRSQTLSATVQFADCSLEEREIALEGDVPGDHRVDFEAVCLGFRVRRAVVVTVGEEDADLRFPLVPGRYWRWTLAAADGATETMDAELLDTRWEDGPLVGLEARVGHQTVQLYGFGGRTWIFERRLGPGPDRHFVPLLAAVPAAPPSDVDGLEPASGDGPFVFVPTGWRCGRFAAPPEGIEGPDDCEGGVTRADPILAGLAILLTAGLALPAVVDAVDAHVTLAESGVAEAPRSSPAERPSIDPSTLSPPADAAEVPRDATVSPSGLAWRVLRAGHGTEHPGPTSRVVLDSTTWRPDGTLVTSSLGHAPDTFALGAVIAGLREGLPLMVEGEERRFWIPGDLAYDALGGTRAPRGPIVMDVVLHGIE